MRRQTLLLAAATLSSASPVVAQPAGTTLIYAGRLLDRPGTAPKQVRFVMKDGRVIKQ
ncbi:MAG TPA: hypothetical protein VFK50_07665 [Sphingomicrobium sp.]|nr:hypothetical protein [Sphingomicrobium sp.]